MPAKKGAVHFYMVYTSRYVSDEAKQAVLNKGYIFDLDLVTGESLYSGINERTAALHFYRACEAARHNPLAYAVAISRDGQTVVRQFFTEL